MCACIPQGQVYDDKVRAFRCHKCNEIAELQPSQMKTFEVLNGQGVLGFVDAPNRDVADEMAIAKYGYACHVEEVS